MVIVAKPVVKNQYWILRDDTQKIGNIQAADDGYRVKINNNVEKYKTINMVKQRTGINFQSLPPTKAVSTTTVYGYPTGCRAFNPMYELPLHLPLFTKTRKSKSWYAAGWYSIYQNRKWQVVQSPKLITLRRYKHTGPYLTKKEADESAN